MLNVNTIGQSVFEEQVRTRLRTTEEQLRDAASRLEARIAEQEIAVALMENRAALSADPRYEEKLARLQAAILDLEAALRNQ